LRAFILDTAEAVEISDSELCECAKVPHHTMTALRQEKIIKNTALVGLANGVEQLRQENTAAAEDLEKWYAALLEKRAELGSDAALAKFLGVSRSYVTRLLDGKRPLTQGLIKKLMD
jgi:antitoxin component HigA of HigAB toxin-antitoxin module